PRRPMTRCSWRRRCGGFLSALCRLRRAGASISVASRRSATGSERTSTRSSVPFLRMRPCEDAVVARGLIVVVVKGYPRLSETFIAQELHGLERAGLRLHIAAMRRPTDHETHPVHRQIRAPVLYLPEYLCEDPLRVTRGLARAKRLPGFRRAVSA